MCNRVVFHSDLNNCYASIECMLHPELRGTYLAVCGSTEERHGIVLAKNQLAKKCGVKTGDVIWEANSLKSYGQSICGTLPKWRHLGSMRAGSR